MSAWAQGPQLFLGAHGCLRPIAEAPHSGLFAATYAFLAMQDVNKDRVQDVLFAFKAASASSNSTNSSCASQGEGSWGLSVSAEAAPWGREGRRPPGLNGLLLFLQAWPPPVPSWPLIRAPTAARSGRGLSPKSSC